jgi:medium-chain acyl-[acyl-carrier-protein] hydrolase
MSAASSRWLVQSAADSDAPVRLVCIPHAGGGASTFHAWRELLKPSIAVCSIQLPGREDRFRETPVRLLPEVLESITDALSSLDDRPFVLFGHSMGAIIAFEVARQLQSAGRTGPAALLVSGRCAPHLLSRAPQVGHLPSSQLLNRIAELYGGIPQMLLADPETAAMMERVLRADLAILERYEYVPGDMLHCPMIAFGGEDDAWVSPSELEAWRQHTRGDFSSMQFRGDHFYFRTYRTQLALVARIRESCLAVALRNQ